MDKFLPILSEEQVESLHEFLKFYTCLKYSNDETKKNEILDTLNRFFQGRMKCFTSKLDALGIMKTIARYFCFVNGIADYELCRWDELVSLTFLVIPEMRVVSEEDMRFRYKNTVFVVHRSYYVYGYGDRDRELTFNLTIY
jgi:hypothetical protein